MPSIKPVVVAAFVLGLTAAASAEPINGRVVDRKTGAPVEGAVVYVAGADGFEETTSSGKDGRYTVDVPPGRYTVVFLHGKSRVTGKVVVEEGLVTKLDGRVDNAPSEVIVLEHTKAPAVMPQPKDPAVATRAPPYSDKAVQQDAWTRAWLLLDVDEGGVVQRVKFLRHPGYDLEPIAVSEAFKLSFTPARNERDQPVRTLIVWPIEWVANSWLLQVGGGLRTRMPEKKGVSGRSSAAYVPCRGSGPWAMDSVYKGYRDCSKPDLAKAKTEPWIVRPE